MPVFRGSVALPALVRQPPLRLAPKVVQPSDEELWASALLAAKQRAALEEEEREWAAALARVKAEEEREWAALRAAAHLSVARITTRADNLRTPRGRFCSFP